MEAVVEDAPALRSKIAAIPDKAEDNQQRLDTSKNDSRDEEAGTSADRQGLASDFLAQDFRHFAREKHEKSVAVSLTCAANYFV